MRLLTMTAILVLSLFALTGCGDDEEDLERTPPAPPEGVRPGEAIPQPPEDVQMPGREALRPTPTPERQGGRTSPEATMPVEPPEIPQDREVDVPEPGQVQ